MQLTLLKTGQYLGSTVQSLRTPLALLTETRYAPDTVLPAHRHERLYFCLVTAGEYEEVSRGERQRYARGHVVYHPPADVHSNRFAPRGGRCFNIEIDPAWAVGLTGRADLERQRPGVVTGNAPWIARRLHREFRGGDDLSDLVGEALLIELAVEALREARRIARGGAPPWLRGVRAELHDRFSERVRLTELAAHAGVHPAHLARAFRVHVGCTVGEYLRGLRIEFAFRQLRQTSAPLSAIAHRAGFADQSHFARAFRRVCGMPPGAYRRVPS